MQEIQIHSQQTSTRNKQMPARSTRMGDQRKDHIDPGGPHQGNHPKQLQTHNLPIDGVEIINSTSCGFPPEEQKGYDLEVLESYFT